MQPVTVVIPGHATYNEYLHYTSTTRFLPQFILKLAIEASILKRSLSDTCGLDESVADQVSEYFANPENGLITYEQKFQLDNADSKTAEVLWLPIVTELNGVVDTVLSLSAALDGVVEKYVPQDFFTDTYEVIGAMYFSGLIYITFGVCNVS